MNAFPKWYKWCMRTVLAGAAICTMAVASVAWLNEPPYSAKLFYLGITLVSIGVVAVWFVMAFSKGGKGK